MQLQLAVWFIEISIITCVVWCERWIYHNGDGWENSSFERYCCTFYTQNQFRIFYSRHTQCWMRNTARPDVRCAGVTVMSIHSVNTIFSLWGPQQPGVLFTGEAKLECEIVTDWCSITSNVYVVPDHWGEEVKQSFTSLCSILHLLSWTFG